MFSAKQLLRMQAAEAFRGRADMPLMASLGAITQEEAAWRPDPSAPTIEQIVRHIAWSKSRFCQRGFGTPMVLLDPSVNDDGDCADLPREFPCGAGFGRASEPAITGAIKLLEAAQQTFTACLDGCSDEALQQPIPTHHGQSAANFFWTMLMHDIYHAGQIRTRGTLFKTTQARAAAGA